jgi:ABC-type transport system substrate-binding protein
MAVLPPSPGRTRALARLVLLLLAAATCGLAVLAGPGERQKKKRTEEERDDPPPAKRRVEEEGGGPRKRRVVRPDDDEKPAAVAEVTDLAQAARLAKHPNVKALFAGLALPHDEVKTRRFSGVTIDGDRSTGGTLRVAPIAPYVTDPRALTRKLTVSILNDAGEVQRTESLGGSMIESIRYYERAAAEQVKAFREEPFARAGGRLFLSAYDQLRAAEQALSAVLRFHLSARERGVRVGEGWDAVSAQLREELLGVQLAQLKELAELKSWDQAFGLARRLTQTYISEKDQARIAGPLEGMLKKVADAPFSQNRLKETRRLLRQLEDQFPGSKVIVPVSDNLRQQAASLLARAKEKEKQSLHGEARALLAQAEEAWPELEGLREYRLQTENDYPIVRVGVRELPHYLSPALAATDAEKRCVELLFESLVRLQADGGGTLSYHPALAVGRPTVVPLGRQFRLPRNARWSDGPPLTAFDVRETVGLMKKGTATGRCAAWGELIKAVRTTGPYKVRLELDQGLLDPLAVMSFKIVPAGRVPHPGSVQFAEKPVGSGPFQFDRRASEDGREFVGLKANPHYGVRDDKRGLPRVKEVLFFAPADPVAAMKGRQIDVAFDLTAEQAGQLAGAGFKVPMPSASAPNRRVYFLAVNHRKAALANADLRVALARAVDREKLLDAHFRKGLDTKVHRALNGPYPAGSWACDPELVSRKDKTSLDPYDPDLAKTKLKQARAKLGGAALAFGVKYPSGDARVKAAVEALCAQVNATLAGVKLTPEERTAELLREDVEVTHSYDLAYYRYDFPDESFWLAPLLGGDENYLGYNGPLRGKVQAAMALRYFTPVRQYAHAIHRQALDSEMPLVPLWQLDPLYAYRGGLKVAGIDPYRVFAAEEP